MSPAAFSGRNLDFSHFIAPLCRGADIAARCPHQMRTLRGGVVNNLNKFALPSGIEIRKMMLPMISRSRSARCFLLLLVLLLGGCRPADRIERATFAMTLPAGWVEDRNDGLYDPNGFVMFENKDSCLFIVVVAKKSKTMSVDLLVEKQRQAYLKKMTNVKAGAFIQWSRYQGKGLRLVGNVGGKVLYDNRIFGFEHGDRVCAIVEAATPGDFTRYAADYDLI